MAEMTQKIIDVDTRCTKIISDAEKEAAALLSKAQWQSREILAEAQHKAAKRRHEAFLKLNESLERFRRQKEEETEAKKRRLLSHFAGKTAAKEIAAAIVRQLVLDLQKGP